MGSAASPGSATALLAATLRGESSAGRAMRAGKLDGEIWSARPYDESLTIKAGETVEVLAMKGATVFRPPGERNPRAVTRQPTGNLS